MCPSFGLSLRQESMVLLRLCQIAGGSTMQNILLILCEVCYLSGESGFLSNFQQFLLWLCAPYWWKWPWKYPPCASQAGVFFSAYCRSNIFRFCFPKGTKAGLNYSWSHRPKLIYLLHLASINCFKSQVTSLFNTSTKVQLPPSVMAQGPHPTC